MFAWALGWGVVAMAAVAAMELRLNGLGKGASYALFLVAAGAGMAVAGYAAARRGNSSARRQVRRPVWEAASWTVALGAATLVVALGPEEVLARPGTVNSVTSSGQSSYQVRLHFPPEQVRMFIAMIVWASLGSGMAMIGQAAPRLGAARIGLVVLVSSVTGVALGWSGIVTAYLLSQAGSTVLQGLSETTGLLIGAASGGAAMGCLFGLVHEVVRRSHPQDSG